jgi:hypothetical protein
MYKPLDVDNELESSLMHPLEAEMRNRFLNIVKKHGNGIWAFEELEWEVYVRDVDRYESMSEEDKIILNKFMFAFRSLYK